MKPIPVIVGCAVIMLCFFAATCLADAQDVELRAFAHHSTPGGWGSGVTASTSVAAQELFGGLVLDTGPSVTYLTVDGLELISAENRIYAVRPFANHAAFYGFLGGGISWVDATGGAFSWTLSRGVGASYGPVFVDASWYDDSIHQTFSLRIGIKLKF